MSPPTNPVSGQPGTVMEGSGKVLSGGINEQPSMFLDETSSSSLVIKDSLDDEFHEPVVLSPKKAVKWKLQKKDDKKWVRDLFAKNSDDDSDDFELDHVDSPPLLILKTLVHHLIYPLLRSSKLSLTGIKKTKG
jgi:hypothetical protein